MRGMFYIFFSLYFFRLIFIGVQLIYSVVLVSAVQQIESVITYTYMHSFSDSFPIEVITEH